MSTTYATECPLPLPRQHNASMTVTAIGAPERLIHWGYMWSALAAIVVMIAAILISNFWLLNFIYVFSSLLWTGFDLFMCWARFCGARRLTRVGVWSAQKLARESLRAIA
jgi:hypothetical protein